MDPKTQQLLQTLVALGQANPNNAGIFNTVTGQVGQALTPQPDEAEARKQKIADAIMNANIQKYTETGDASYLKDVEDMTSSKDPLAFIKGLTTKTQSLEGVPDELKESILGEKYKSAVQKAMTSNDYSAIDKLKADNPDYDFSTDEKTGDFTVKKTDEPGYGLDKSLVNMFGGEGAAQEYGQKQELRQLADEYKQSKGGVGALFNPNFTEDDTKGFEEFLKGKGKSSSRYSKVIKPGVSF